MDGKPVWGDRYASLMARGNLGSACACGDVNSASELIMPHSSTALTGASEPKQPQPAVGYVRALKAWVRGTVDRFGQSSRNRELRQTEAYLAQARDPADLEYRIRRLDDSLLARARILG